MSGVFDALVEEFARGKTPRAAAAVVGVPEDLALAAAAEATRRGLTFTLTSGCAGCAPRGPAAAAPTSPLCAGCPLAAGGR